MSIDIARVCVEKNIPFDGVLDLGAPHLLRSSVGLGLGIRFDGSDVSFVLGMVTKEFHGDVGVRVDLVHAAPLTRRELLVVVHGGV
jgi:hypothetical protein